MGKFVGRLVTVGVGVEATRGVGVAPTFLLPQASLSFDDKINKVRSIAGLGKLADSEEAFVATKYAQGDIEAELRDDVVGCLLYALFGTLSTSGPTDSAYTHAFSIDNDVDTKSLALVVNDDNTKEIYRMVMLDTLEFTSELDSTVMISASFLSRTAVPSTITMPSIISETKFTKKHVKVKVAANVGSLTAATELAIKRLRLTFSKGAVIDDVMGTAEPEDVLGTQFSVEGELELNYEDETWKDYFTVGTNRAMEIKFVNADVTIGAAINPSLTFRLPKVDFFEWEPNYALGEIVSQRVSFKGSYDSANGLEIVSTCSLVNETVSY